MEDVGWKGLFMGRDCAGHCRGKDFCLNQQHHWTAGPWPGASEVIANPSHRRMYSYFTNAATPDVNFVVMRMRPTSMIENELSR